MKEYALWLTIELIDEDNDIYEDQDLPLKHSTYDTLEEAMAAMDRLAGL